MNSSTYKPIVLQHMPDGWDGTLPMSFQQQNMLIEMYLNEQAFYHRSLQRNEESDLTQIKSESKTENSAPISEESQPTVRPAEERNKSIFHNFQKHLITIIKKYMNLTKNKVIQCQDGPLAFQLWQAFMKTNSFNKKLLHTVFGVESSFPPTENLVKLASNFPEFSHICAQTSWKLIQSAQRLIRERIVEQAHHLSKFFLKSNSNITKFNEFYAYYCNFILEIQQGPMSKRMTKTSKQALMEIIKPKRSA